MKTTAFRRRVHSVFFFRADTTCDSFALARSKTLLKVWGVFVVHSVLFLTEIRPVGLH